jgi:hypothetical protein
MSARPSIEIRTPEVLERNWGQEIITTWTPTHAGKVLRRKAGTIGGFQMHVKEESHYLYEGSLTLESIEDGQVVTRTLTTGAAWTVPPLTLHRERADTDCVLFEVSDPTREDRYAIVPDPGGLPSMTDDQAWKIAYDLRSALITRSLDIEETEVRLLEESLSSIAGPIPESVTA